MSKFFLIWGWLLFIGNLANCFAAINELCKAASNDQYYIYSNLTKTYRAVADVDNVRFLGFDPNKFRSFTFTSSVTFDEPIAKAALPPPNPDTAIANMLIKVNALSPQNFWKSNIEINMFNPSIAKWKGKYIMAYRNGSNIAFTWMRFTFDGRFEPLYQDTLLGLRDEYGSSPYDTSQSKSLFREDPRLLVRDGGSFISLSFVRLHATWDVAQINYLNISVKDHKVHFTGEHTLLTAGKQKNWMPFEYLNDQYWIASVNPLHIVRHASTQQRPDDNDKLVAVVEDVVNEAEEIPLPWDGYYGLPIRGGTPAIKVHGYYLAFFHTLSKFQDAFKLSTYFMGAIAFCPEPPFHIHAMSAHPILQDFLYQVSSLLVLA